MIYEKDSMRLQVNRFPNTNCDLLYLVSKACFMSEILTRKKDNTDRDNISYMGIYWSDANISGWKRLKSISRVQNWH